MNLNKKNTSLKYSNLKKILGLDPYVAVKLIAAVNNLKTKF